MLELQHIRFAGWALTEGQHRPKAGKKKKTREAGLFFLVFPLSSGDASSRSGLTHFSPHSNIYLSIYLSPFHTMVSTSEAAPGASPGQWLAICHVIRYPRVQTHQRVASLAKRVASAPVLRYIAIYI